MKLFDLFRLNEIEELEVEFEFFKFLLLSNFNKLFLSVMFKLLLLLLLLKF